MGYGDLEAYVARKFVQCDVGERVLIERAQERGQRFVKHARQPADRRSRALVAGGEALDQGKARLGRTHHIDRLDDGAADTLLGGDGNDVLLGGGGADRLSGGTGWDTASYVDSYAVSVNLATGAAQGNDAAGDVLTGIENLLGSHWNDNLTGNGGNNVLTGSGGNDTLRGGAGQDRLVGDEGADRLYGGGGADRFVFEVALDSPYSGGDTIFDFSVAGGDVIDLRALDAIPGGGDNALLFRGSGAFTDTGQVRAFQSGGNTVVAVNLTGGATPEMRITLAGLHALTGDDFNL